LLERLVPAWRDGLKMAARADGRVEQVPHDFWGCWHRWRRQWEGGSACRQEKMRSPDDAARSPRPRKR
jgi:hypothetical protein